MSSLPTRLSDLEPWQITVRKRTFFTEGKRQEDEK